MRVWMIPPAADYHAALAAALRRSGCDVDSSERMFGPRRLWERRREPAVLHLNWHYLLYFLSGRIGTARALVRYLFSLAVARLLGYRLVWSVHNLCDHGGRYPVLDRIGGMATAHLAHVVTVFSEWAKGEVRRVFQKRNDVRVIRVGPYSAPSRNHRAGEEVRSREGWGAEHCVFLLFGDLRRDKGIAAAVRAFGGISDAHAVLWLVGRVCDPRLRNEVEAAAHSDPRIRCRFGFIADEEVEGVFRAADAVLLPYEDILNSGVLILAGDYGRFLIAPDLGLFRELIRPGGGRLFKPGSIASLARAMQAAIDLARAGGMRRNENPRVVRYDSWDETARRLMDAYRGGSIVR